MKIGHLGVCALLLTAAGCNSEERVRIKGSGVAKTEARQVAAFSKVDLLGVGRLELRTGPLGSVEVTADDNILPVLETRVEGDRLVIRPTEKAIKPVVGIVIKATAPNIESVQCAGAASVALEGVANDKLVLVLTGAGKALVSGSTAALDVTMNGAGSLEAGDLQAKTAEIEINGAGEADVHVLENLKVVIKGTGKVRYAGDPQVERSVIGIGTISRKE